MRALIITVVLAALGLGGYFAYSHMRPPAPPQQQANVFAPTPPPTAVHGAEQCSAQNARYRLRSDPRVYLTFALAQPIQPRPAPVGGLIEQPGPPEPPLIFVLEITTKAEEHRFQARPAPAGYERNLLYPIANGRTTTPSESIEVDLFNKDYDFAVGLPLPDTAAPAHIFSSDLTRYIYNLGGDRRVDSPIGFFDFDECRASPAPPAH